ncbi:MFS transporter [Streptomyces naganishii]|uniref:MFS transporter n=1 Tax=Streptomyces naganishii JCM 4654 TaxID=1306179 RepID=A0A918Y6X5_9ACTN|nr:MFS transporter [Streptomyces naganishii]GHD91942.1 MFS transporter [Streptomyces naganishii JCM 4654]
MADTATPQVQETKTRADRLKTFAGVGLGNALEWFDWNIYAIFAPYLAAQFFSSSDQLSAVLSTLAVFAVGFAARPFGGFVFGWIADRRGRRFAMSLSVGGAAAGSLLIGIAPAYGAVGALASLVLLLARLVQGLAHGGELPAAQTYIAETAPGRRRGLWASLIYVSGTVGIMAGTALGAVMATVLSSSRMEAWGWRVPFVLGGLFGLYALAMRLRMPETEAFEEESGKDVGDQDRPSMWRTLAEHRKQALQVVGMTVGLTVAYYAWAVSAPQYAISSRGLDPAGALWAGLAANVVFLVALPLWGALSDRIGRKPVLLVCSLGTVAVIFPLNSLVGRESWRLGLAMAIAMIFIAAGAAIVPAVYAELFPTRIRTIGVAVPYALCVAAFGGTAPYLQTWMGAELGGAYFTAYTAMLLLISSAAIVTLPETRNRSMR